MRLIEPVRSRWLLAALGLCLAVGAGCADDEPIARYTAPKTQPKPLASPAAASQSKREPGRMLGAIVSQGDSAWFFKLAGPAEAIGQQAEAFDGFVRSLRFDDRAKPRWTVPDGWEQLPGNEFRYATLRRPGRDGQPALELTVTVLPRSGDDESAYLLLNVNRWRNQLQQPPLSPAELEQQLRRIEVEGVEVVLTDIEGLWSPDSGMPPFARGAK